MPGLDGSEVMLHGDNKLQGTSWTLVAVATFSALGGFIFGYDLGLIGGALLGFSKDLNIHRSISQSSIVGALKLGSFVGAFVGGALMLRYGRRKAIALCSMFGVLGPLVMAGATGVGALIAGRAVSGIGVGACAIIVPAYLAEVAPASHRGAVVQMYEMMLCVGLFVSTLINWGLSHLGPSAWRVMVGLPAVPGGLLAGSLLLLPESPRWLIMRGHLDLALKTIHTVLGRKKSPLCDVFVQDAAAIAQAEDELLLLWSSVEKDKHTVLERRRHLLERRCKQPAVRAVPNDSGLAAEAAIEGSADPLLGGGGFSSSSPALGTRPVVDATGSMKWRCSIEQGPPASQHKSGRRLDASVLPSPTHAELDGAQQQGNPASPNQGVDADDNRLDNGADQGCTPALQPLNIPPSHTSKFSPDLHASGHGVGKGHGRFPGKPDPASRTLAAAFGGDLGPLQHGASVHEHQGTSAHDGEGVLGHRISAVGEEKAFEDVNLQQGLAGDEVSGWRGQHVEGTEDGLAKQGLLAGHSHSSHQEPLHIHSNSCNGAGEEASLLGSGTLSNPQGQQVPQGEHSEVPGQESNLLKTQFNMLLDIYAVATGKESRTFRLVCLLAVFNQATASTAIINYAPTLLQRISGAMSDAQAQLFLAAIALTKVVGVGIGMCTVDGWGRRPLLMWGAAGCAVAMACSSAAYQASSTLGLLAFVCAFVLAFSMSWAGVYWVIASECFSMGAKSPATSAATALLFLTGGLFDLVFQLLVDRLEGFCLLVFAGVAVCSGIYVWAYLPETKGKSLQSVQAIINKAGEPAEG